MKKPTYVPHLLTYLFAAKYCYGKNVMDLGCGDGYGGQLLSYFAKSVTGYDISPRAVESARTRGIAAYVRDLDTEGLPGQLPDIIVALEVLEHVEKPDLLADVACAVVFSVPYDYPHVLHKSTYTDEVQVKNLFPGREMEIRYQGGMCITEEKPAVFERYVCYVP